MIPNPPARVRSQLAHFLHIPMDWNATNHGDTIVLSGPGGATAELPNQKSDFLPAQWRAAAAAAILKAVPVDRKSGAIPLAEYLSLPMGWKATAFPSTLEFEGPNGERCGMPLPYNPTPRETLMTQAHDSISRCLNT